MEKAQTISRRKQLQITVQMEWCHDIYCVLPLNMLCVINSMIKNGEVLNK
jgi:hypothetical protein